MKETTGTFQVADGTQLFYRTIRAEPEAAHLVIAHGLGEHSGRYDPVINLAVPLGISVWALDHRGHGRSEGSRGHVRNFDQYVLDLKQFVVSVVSGRTRDRNRFLLGHSMGGLISLLFALHYPSLIDGLIVSSPVLGLWVPAVAIKAILVRMATKMLPNLSLHNKVDVDRISHDLKIIEAYRNDPLNHHRITVFWMNALFKSMHEAHLQAPTLSVPILMQVAGEDYLVDASASTDFYRKLVFHDKTFHRYNGLYHEIYNETPVLRTPVLADLEAWLHQRIDVPRV